jgi:hypothetical protein
MKFGVLAVLLTVIFAGADAMAMGMSGGPVVPGSTQSPTGPNDRASRDYGNQNKKKDDKKDDFQKAQLPPPLDIKQLDTARYEATKDSLKLTDEQLKKIEATIKDIKAEGTKLAKDQDETRKAYDAAATQTVANEAAQKVMAVRDQISNYDPNRKFAAELQRTLKPDQWKTYVTAKI